MSRERTNERRNRLRWGVAKRFRLLHLNCYFFLFLSFIFARTPGGELAHFSSLWWCHYQLGENSLFFYSHPLVDLRDRIFNLRQFFIFFLLWGVNNSICLNLNYSCSHPRMFHPPEKNNSSFRWWNMFPNDFFSPWKNQTKISSWPICGIGNSKTMTDLIRRAYDTQSFSCWLPDSTFSPHQSWLCWTTFSSSSRNKTQKKNWSKVNQPKVYFF